MKVFPYPLRFVHEGILGTDVHARNNLLLVEEHPILLREVEEFVILSLLGRLLHSHFFERCSVVEKLPQVLWLPSDEVHIGWRMLDLTIVEARKNSFSCFPSSDMCMIRMESQ